MWSGMSKASQKKEKHQWAIEEPKLDNARKLRGISLIDPDDGGGHAFEAEDEEASQQAAGDRRNQRFQQNPKDKACMHRGAS